VDTSTPIAAVDTLGRRVAPRRYRTVEKKVQIVTESRVLGASVSEVARRHGVNANQVFAWRRQQDQGVLGRRTRRGGVKLVRVQVRGEAHELRTEAGTARATASASEGRIEIILGDGVRIAISGVVSAEQLHPVLSVLR
jgi:transposase-like protein